VTSRDTAKDTAILRCALCNVGILDDAEARPAVTNARE